MVDLPATSPHRLAPRPGAPLLPLFGRELDLDSLRAMLDLPATRLLTITGIGGVGKTRLALELAELTAASRRVVVVELAPVADVAFVVPTIAAALGVAAPQGRHHTDDVVDLLASSPTLLVLDNLEHLPEAAPVVVELLAGAPQLQIVVTSRVALRVRGEHLWRLRPLSVPAAGHEVDPHGPAVQWFCSVARANDGRFQFDPGNAGDIAAICRRLDGHPLAIELAAARIATFGPAALRRELDRRSPSEFLASGAADVPPRHRDLRSAIEWSCDILDDPARTLLRRMSVFESWVDLDSLEAVCTDDAALLPPQVVDALSALVDHHLLDAAHDAVDTRYRLSPPIRDVAASMLGEHDDDRRAMLTAHRDHLRSLARAAVEHFDEDDEESWLTRVSDLQDDLLAALERALDDGDAADAVDLVAALAWIWSRSGVFSIHARLVERVATLDGLAAADGLDLLTFHGWRSVIAAMDGADAAALRRMSAEVTCVAGDTDDAGRARTVLLHLQQLRAFVIAADYVGAAEMATRALEAAGGRDDRWTARAEALAGMVAHQRGHLADAERLGRTALDRSRRMHDDKTVIRATLLLRPLVPGAPASEIPTLEETVAIARRLGDGQALDWVRPTLAAHALAEGRVDEAARLCREALASGGASRSVGNSLCALILGMVAARREPLIAARVSGFLADRWPQLSSVLTPSQRVLYEHSTAVARTSLGDEAFTAAARGMATLPRHLALDELIAFADRTIGPDDDTSPVSRPGDPTAALTPRELEVLRAVAHGGTNKDISRQLGLSPKTVMHHTTAIYRKLGARGRTEAAAIAHRCGLLSDDRT